jgi:alanyl-tRNA synthetase
MSQAEAKDFGAVALFGETYDELVRVVQIGGPWSRELCGGTHVSRSSQVGLVSLGAESSVGSGSRRIEALVGIEAFRSLASERALVSRLADLVKVPTSGLENRIELIIEDLKSTQKRLSISEQAELSKRIPNWIAEAKQIGSLKFVLADVGEQLDVENLRSLATSIRALAGENSIIVVVARVDAKIALVATLGSVAITAGNKAGDLVKIASAILGGGGGGKPDLAQGGGADVARLNDALIAIEQAIV